MSTNTRPRRSRPPTAVITQRGASLNTGRRVGASAPTTLMHHPVTGAGQHPWMKAWAATAEPRDCTHCARPFQPNHPRRQACGQPDCASIAAQRAAATRPVNALARAREAGVQGLFADVMMLLNSPDGPDGTRDELVAAVAEIAAAERLPTPRSAQRAAYAQLIAAAAARALKLTETA